jgi:hypothetical protein
VGLFELKFSFFVLHRLFQRKPVSKETFYKVGFCIIQLVSLSKLNREIEFVYMIFYQYIDYGET